MPPEAKSMTLAESNLFNVNGLIKLLDLDKNKISDGYHTFGELYQHRIVLFMALCREIDDTGKGFVWMSRKHSDGSEWDGWFILGINREPGKQITYHLPVSYWDECMDFALELPKAEWDGHTSNDVLERLKSL